MPRDSDHADQAGDSIEDIVRPPAQNRRAGRVLMILFHFPPLGGVAVPRNIRNVQYLPRFGWQPVVVAPRDAAGPVDPYMGELVPSGTRVVRARCLEPRDLRRAVDPIRRIADAARRASTIPLDRAVKGRPAAVATSYLAEREPPQKRPAPGWLWRLHRLLSFPDSQVGWLPFAAWAALRDHRATPFDAVYSTSAPITAHLVAGVIKRLTGLPWVAEFRDPWLGSPIATALGGQRPWLHRRLQVKVERWIMRSADQIVFLSPSTMRHYRARYPDAARMVTITNGHDRADARERPSRSTGQGRYRIVYAGTLRPRELQTFLAGVEGIVKRRPALSDELEILFYGELSNDCRVIADRFSADDSLGSILSFDGWVPRHVVLDALADADAALLLLGAGPGMGQVIPAKLFELLGQDKQILAMLPPGDARDILQELGWGVIADPDVADVERAIERLLAAEPPSRPADPEGRYDRVALAARLAATLDQASQARQRAPTTGSVA